MTLGNATSRPAPTIMRDYPGGRVPRETIRVADDVYYRFDQLVGTTATYNLASRKAWQDMTRDECDADQQADNKAHKNWLRVTKWLRDDDTALNLAASILAEAGFSPEEIEKVVRGALDAAGVAVATGG